MKKIIALIPLLLVSACGDGASDKVLGPDDYVNISDMFTMDESTATEMTMDGGSPTTSPKKVDPHAAMLAADALPGDKIGEMLTSKPQNSASIDAR